MRLEQSLRYLAMTDKVHRGWKLLLQISYGKLQQGKPQPSHFFIISAMAIEETGVMDEVHVIIPGSRNLTMLL